MTKQRKPYFKFRPESWLNDEGLALCSPASHGLWIGMLARMHMSEEYGVLIINGKVPTIASIARLFRWEKDLVGDLIGELKENQVVSERDCDGALFSRRMIRDFAAGELGRESVQKRWNQREIEKSSPNSPPKTSPNTKTPDSRYHNNYPSMETRIEEILGEVWPLWPKRGKERTTKAKVRVAIAKSGNSFALIPDAVRAYLKSKDATKDGGEYVPGLHVWLKDKLETWVDFVVPLVLENTKQTPSWFSALKARFDDSDFSEDWRNLWSRCDPIEDGNPIVLRSPTPALHRALANPDDAQRFFYVVGRPVKILPPEPTLTR